MCSSLLCLCCYSDTFDSMHIRPPPAIVVSLLKELVLPCNKGCGKMVRLERYITHADDKCQGHYESTDSPSKMTMSEVLLRPSNVPVTPAERKVAGHLVKKILHHQSEPQGVLKVPTSGQVCIKSHCITVVKVMIILCLLYKATAGKFPVSHPPPSYNFTTTPTQKHNTNCIKSSPLP